MSRYPGGIISATAPTVTTSSAKGIWTLQEALQYKKAGNWPSAFTTVIQTFNSSTTWTCPTGVTEVEYLIVAGGGGTGSASDPFDNGAGGAGGLLTATGQAVTAGTTYTITIGGGGGAATPGSSSSAVGISTTGGGQGGGRNGNGGNGGSGGGAGYLGSTGGTGVAGPPRQGYNGALSFGGGAGGAATNSTRGPGADSSLSGSTVTYAVGGDGSNQNGTTNRGNGACAGASARSGGSGIVILKYLQPV